MDPKLKRLLLNSAAVVWLQKYGLHLLVIFLAWFLARWHFREFESQIPYQREIITPDELYWVLQSLQFRQALLDGNLQGLVQSAHPGTITMWMGTIGATIKLWFTPELQEEVSWLVQQEWVLPQSGELSNRLYPFLAPGRNALRWLVTGLWLAIFQLVRERVANKLVLFFTMFILVTDMWILGLTNILHVDGLLALFSVITLLLVLPQNDTEIGWHQRRRYLLAGVTMGCAILSKVPGLVLLVVVPGAMLAQQLVINSRYSFASRTRFLKHFGYVLIGLFGTFAVLAPIIFINPAYVFENVFALSSREIGFSAPTFFLGRVTETPGILFYPLTLLFRQQIFVTLGLVIALAQLIRSKGKSNNWIFAGTSVVFSVLFLIGLLISDREFARYAIPIFVIISLIGAISIANFVDRLPRPENLAWFLKAPAVFGLILGIVFLVRTGSQIDPFVFTNPLVGGTHVGPRLMLTTWGGEHSTASAFANLGSAPLGSTAQRTIFTDNVPAVAPFANLSNTSVFLLNDTTARLIKPEDQVLLSLENKVLNPERWEPETFGGSGGDIIKQIVTESEPTSTVDSGGVPRVYIYSEIDPDLLDSGRTRYPNGGFTFGNQLVLAESTVIKEDDEFDIHLLLRWRARAPESSLAADGQNAIIKLAITDDVGRTWVVREDPLVDIEDRPAATWSAGREYLSIHTLPLASDMPPESFQVNISYFSADGSLNGVTDSLNQFVGTSAEIASLKVQVPPLQPPVAYPEGSILVNQNDIQVIQPVPDSIGQGGRLGLEVWVQSSGDQNQTLTLDIGDVSLDYPLAADEWQTGHVYRLHPEWLLPLDIPAGEYPILLNDVKAGTIMVNAVERSFELDPNLNSRGIQVGDLGFIHALLLDRSTNVAKLIWEVNQPDSLNYAAFFQLLDDDFSVLYQVEREPGRATSQTVQGEIIEVTEEMPADIVEEARYLVTGFVNPITGVRLPIIRISDGLEPAPRHLLNDLKPNNE